MREKKNPSYEELLEYAMEAARQGRKVLLDYFGDLTRVSEKAKAGLVTEADLASEKVITEHLRFCAPQIDFIAEEESFKNQTLSWGTKEESGSFWIIDPLDGTTNFVHEFPIYCISIGLYVNGQTQLGLIDVPALGSTYSTVRGSGSKKNGQPIHVSERSQLNDSLLATGFYHHEKDVINEQLNIFTQLIGKVRGVRRAGAAAFDLCMVAEGVFDGFWEKNLQPWDTCAGELLVQEAGGTVSDYQGNKYQPFINSIVATNKKLHPKILSTIEKSIAN